MAIGLCIVGIFSVSGLVLAEQIIALFQPEANVIKIGADALRYASIGLLFTPVAVPINMLYQSIRKSGIASILSLMRSGLTFIPLLFILSSTMGLKGIQLAQPASDILTGLVCAVFIILFLKTTPNEQ